jgi:hypothetical protein
MPLITLCSRCEGILENEDTVHNEPLLHLNSADNAYPDIVKEDQASRSSLQENDTESQMENADTESAESPTSAGREEGYFCEYMSVPYADTARKGKVRWIDTSVDDEEENVFLPNLFPIHGTFHALPARRPIDLFPIDLTNEVDFQALVCGASNLIIPLHVTIYIMPTFRDRDRDCCFRSSQSTD